MRRLLLAYALLTGTCHHSDSASTTGGAPASSPAPSTSAGAPVTDSDRALHALEALGVFDDRFAVREVYSWTTKEQVAELRKSRVLITRTESPAVGISGFDHDLIGDKSPFSRALRHPVLAKRRFAWTAAWATVLGLSDRRYGDRLIRIVLKPTAIIARFEAGTEHPWTFSRAQGEPMQEEDVKKQIRFLGAVFHVARPGPNDSATPPYREMVLCNESAIESWSVGTPEIAKRLDDERLLVGLVLQKLLTGAQTPLSPDWALHTSTSVWPTKSGSDLDAAWGGAIAFANDRYALEEKRVQALLDALLAVPGAVDDERIHVHPDVTFPAIDFQQLQKGPPATPLRPRWNVPT